MKADCKTCRYAEIGTYARTGENEAAIKIRCHRYAPRPVDHSSRLDSDLAYFPTVIGARFCGEYEPKEED